MEEQEKVEEQFTALSLNEGPNSIYVLRKIIICNDQFQTGFNYDETLAHMSHELQAHRKCS